MVPCALEMAPTLPCHWIRYKMGVSHRIACKAGCGDRCSLSRAFKPTGRDMHAVLFARVSLKDL